MKEQRNPEAYILYNEWFINIIIVDDVIKYYELKKNVSSADENRLYRIPTTTKQWYGFRGWFAGWDRRV